MNQDNDEHPSFETTRTPTPHNRPVIYSVPAKSKCHVRAHLMRRLTSEKYFPISRTHRHCCCHTTWKGSESVFSQTKANKLLLQSSKMMGNFSSAHQVSSPPFVFSPQVPFLIPNSELSVLSDWGMVVSVASIFNRRIRLHLTLFGFLGESSTCTTLPLHDVCLPHTHTHQPLHLHTTAAAKVSISNEFCFWQRQQSHILRRSYGNVSIDIWWYTAYNRTLCECGPGMVLVGPLFSSSKCMLHFL